MKRICLLLLLALTHLACHSQEVIEISSDVELVKLSDNAYIHTSYSTLPGYGRVAANGLIFIEKDQAFLFDTPWNDSLTSILVSYMEDHQGLKIQGFVPNHWHDDCMGGLGFLKSCGINSWANQLTIDIAADKGLPLPDQGFMDSLKIMLGEKSIHCYYFGPAHSMDNIVVWIPSEKILFPGCICKNLDSRNLGNISDGDLAEYPSTVDRITARFRDAKIIIPGHGLYGGTELLTFTRSLCNQN
jgi:metallo-beta-lactamase class B